MGEHVPLNAPGEGIEFELGWRWKPHPGSGPREFPAGRGRRFGEETLSVGARNGVLFGFAIFGNNSLVFTGIWAQAN